MAAPQPDHATKAIQDIRVGDRVLGENPLPEDVDAGVAEPEPSEWRRGELLLVKPDGGRL